MLFRSRKPTAWQRLTKALGPIGVVLVMIANFFGKIKFLLFPLVKFGLPVLKTCSFGKRADV